MDRRFPIGRFEAPESIIQADVDAWIDRIESLPVRLREAVHSLSDARIDEAYRPGGWTRRQVVHHIADSHMNSLVRFKWTLTESTPTIKAYDEASWAELADYRDVPLEASMDFLAALHARWIPLLRSLDAAQLERRFIHPETGATVRLDENIGIYAWHGDHHLAHLLLE